MKGESISKNCYGTAVNLFADRSDNKVRLGTNADAVCTAKIDLWFNFPCDITDFQDITRLIINNIFSYFDFSCIAASLTERLDKSPFKLALEQGIDGNIAELAYLFHFFSEQKPV